MTRTAVPWGEVRSDDPTHGPTSGPVLAFEVDEDGDPVNYLNPSDPASRILLLVLRELRELRKASAVTYVWKVEQGSSPASHGNPGKAAKALERELNAIEASGAEVFQILNFQDALHIVIRWKGER